MTEKLQELFRWLVAFFGVSMAWIIEYDIPQIIGFSLSVTLMVMNIIIAAPKVWDAWKKLKAKKKGKS